MNTPETTQEALNIWDSGNSIETIEMGGLGEGYENGIHAAAFEIIRVLDGSEIPEETKEINELFDKTLRDAMEALPELNGLSGAMAGAAKQVAYKAITDGWKGMRDSIPEDRLITIKRLKPNN